MRSKALKEGFPINYLLCEYVGIRRPKSAELVRLNCDYIRKNEGMLEGLDMTCI